MKCHLKCESMFSVLCQIAHITDQSLLMVVCFNLLVIVFILFSYGGYAEHAKLFLNLFSLCCDIMNNGLLHYKATALCPEKAHNESIPYNVNKFEYIIYVHNVRKIRAKIMNICLKLSELRIVVLWTTVEWPESIRVAQATGKWGQSSSGAESLTLCLTWSVVCLVCL